MNFEEKRNVRYRVVASLILLIPLALIVNAAILVFKNLYEDTWIALAAIGVVSFFEILELVLLLKKPKKELIIYPIAFNKNDTVNNIPLIAVGVGTALGIGLVTLSLIVFFINGDSIIKMSMGVVLAIASYLLANCVDYIIFIPMLRKKQVTLQDLSK